MNPDQKKKEKKGMRRDLIILLLLLIATLLIIIVLPEKEKGVSDASWDFLIEMMLILPAIMVILGLFAVWVPKKLIGKYLGHTSGIKGIILALILGALPTGPLYIAFPMAVALLAKGAKRSNIIIFLSAWACIKIPQEMVELRFLGLEFMLLRLALTIIFVVVMGVTIEKIMELSDKKASRSSGV